jgi:hypothetical protein
MAKEEALAHREKLIYAVGTFLIASVVSIITSSTAIGISLVNIIVAISIGFLIYRPQDIWKVIQKDSGTK